MIRPATAFASWWQGSASYASTAGFAPRWTEHQGETGVVYWCTRLFGEIPNQIRVRMVEYIRVTLRSVGAQKACL
jgi:hypothetical protein